MTIDLKTGTAYAPRPSDNMMKMAAVAPDASCATPQWRAFLDRVTDGDAELQDYLQRVCGYCLTGRTMEHVLFFLYGSGANGKSVFLNTIAGMMGDYAQSAPIETFLAARYDRHPTELAMLRGARLVTATETDEGRRWDESKVKAITGGDPISARFMRQDFFTYTPQFKLMIAGNHKPHLRTVDEAIRRRIHLVPFTVTIPAAERDDALSEKLKAEWPGILAWAIAGCMEWRRTGLRPPTAVSDATREYLDSEDAIAFWIAECCTIGSSHDDLTATLYASWRAHADRSGKSAGSMKAFSQALEARGLRKKRGGGGKRMFTGISVIREDTSEAWWKL